MHQQVYMAGQRRGVTRILRKKLKRRNAIEPIIGHMKADGHLDRNFLKGRLGDVINALMAGAGQNLRMILKRLRLPFAFVMRWLFRAPRAKSSYDSSRLNSTTRRGQKNGIF